MNKIGYKPHGLAFKLMALMLPGVTIFSVPLAQAKAARAAKFNGKAAKILAVLAVALVTIQLFI